MTHDAKVEKRRGLLAFPIGVLGNKLSTSSMVLDHSLSPCDQQILQAYLLFTGAAKEDLLSRLNRSPRLCLKLQSNISSDQLRTILDGMNYKVRGYDLDCHHVDLLTHTADLPALAVRTHTAVSFMSILVPNSKSTDPVVVNEVVRLTSTELGGAPIDVALSPFSLSAGLLATNDSVFCVDWKEKCYA
jgi:hypothetical protein